MRGKKAKKLRKILGKEGALAAINTPLDDTNYQLRSRQRLDGSMTHVIECKDNSNRQLYKILKRTFKGNT